MRTFDHWDVYLEELWDSRRTVKEFIVESLIKGKNLSFICKKFKKRYSNTDISEAAIEQFKTHFFM
jgi:hypothetical protein